MIIKKIEVDGFGKLENFQLNLDSGVQVIYGPNEFGKSTLMEFIKRMFYSRCGGEKFSSKDRELRKKYFPWSGKKLSGAIEFSHNGDLYRIQKEFGLKSSSGDKVTVQNLSTKEFIELGKRCEVGEHFFGIDVKSFERSSYIASIGRIDFCTSKNSKDGIVEKILSNLSSAGEEDISERVAIKNIDDAIKNLQFVRGNGGKIFDTKSEISQIVQKILNLEAMEKSNFEIEKEFSEIQKLLNEKNFLNSQLEKFRNLKKIQIAIEIKNLITEKNKVEQFFPIVKNNEIIKNLNREKDEMEKLRLKLEEIQNITENSNSNYTNISDEEIKILEHLIEEKNSIEIKINCLNKLLINSDFGQSFNNFENSKFSEDLNYSNEINDFIKKRKILDDEIIEIEKKISSEQKFLSDIEYHLSLSENNFSTSNSRKFTYFIKVLNIVVFICFAIYGAVCKFFLPLKLYSIPFISLLIFETYHSLKIRNKKKMVDSKKEERNLLIDKIHELQNKKICDLEKLETINVDIKSMILNYEKVLDERNGVIDSVISEKNCNSVREYFINYEKSKTKKDIYDSYKNELLELNCKELNFVKKISQYTKNVKSVQSAIEFLDNAAALNTRMQLLNEKIKIKTEYLGLNLNDSESLDIFINDLKGNCIDINLNEEKLNCIKRRIDELTSLNLEEKCVELQKKIKIPCENKEVLQKELDDKKVKLKNMELYLKSLKTAKTVIEESAEELRKIFSPTLNSRVSEIFSKLTEEKYTGVHVTKEYDISINHGMQSHLAENFSSGTIDQAYFSLRMAVSEMISGKNHLPIIIDDSFRQYDSKRLEKVLKFLSEYKKGSSQSIIFTCHESVAKAAKIKGANIIKMSAN